MQGPLERRALAPWAIAHFDNDKDKYNIFYTNLSPLTDFNTFCSGEFSRNFEERISGRLGSASEPLDESSASSSDGHQQQQHQQQQHQQRRYRSRPDASSAAAAAGAALRQTPGSSLLPPRSSNFESKPKTTTLFGKQMIGNPDDSMENTIQV